MKSSTAAVAIIVFLLFGLVGGYMIGAPSLQGSVNNLTAQVAARDSTIVGLQNQVASLRASANISVLGPYFSPDGPCQAQVIAWIGRANTSLHVLIYSFTNDQIGAAVQAAHTRGVDVKVVFEYEQISQYSEYEKLLAAGVSVRVDSNSALMHDKVAIVDSKYVLTGSFNWSAAAQEDNNENILVLKNMSLATVYEAEFQKIWNAAL